MNKPSTLLLFDIDGTLVYSDKIDSQCFAETYEEIYGKKFPTIDWRKYPHVTDHVIFNTVIGEHFGRPAGEEEIQVFQNYFVEKIEAKRKSEPHEFMEVPNACGFIDGLLATGEFAIGIGTGGWLAPAKVKLAHVGIPSEKLFVSAADNQPTRRHIVEEVIRQAEMAHGEFARTVYIGDAVWDVETTREMGLPFIGIRRNGDAEVLRQAGAATVFHDFREEEIFMEAVFSALPPK